MFANATAPTVIVVVLVWLAILAVYTIPTWVALLRHHTQWGAILALNLLLGWTLIGWAGALVWACTTSKYMSSHPAQHQPQWHTPPPPPPPPQQPQQGWGKPPS